VTFSGNYLRRLSYDSAYLPASSVSCRMRTPQPSLPINMRLIDSLYSLQNWISCFCQQPRLRQNPPLMPSFDRYIFLAHSLKSNSINTVFPSSRFLFWSFFDFFLSRHDFVLLRNALCPSPEKFSPELQSYPSVNSQISNSFCDLIATLYDTNIRTY